MWNQELEKKVDELLKLVEKKNVQCKNMEMATTIVQELKRKDWRKEQLYYVNLIRAC